MQTLVTDERREILESKPQDYQLVAADLAFFRNTDKGELPPQPSHEQSENLRAKIIAMKLEENTALFDQLLLHIFHNNAFFHPLPKILLKLIHLDELIRIIAAAEGLSHAATPKLDTSEAVQAANNRRAFLKYYLVEFMVYIYRFQDQTTIPAEEQKFIIRGLAYLKWVFLGKDNLLRIKTLEILKQITLAIEKQGARFQVEAACRKNVIKHFGINVSDLWNVGIGVKIKEWLRRSPFRATGYALIIIALLIWVVFSALSMPVVFPGTLGLIASGCFIYHFWLRDQLKYLVCSAMVAAGFGLLFWQITLPWIWAPALAMIVIGSVLGGITYYQHAALKQGSGRGLLYQQLINNNDYVVGAGLIAVLVLAVSLISDQISIASMLLPWLSPLAAATASIIGFSLLAVTALIAAAFYGYYGYTSADSGKFIYSFGYAVLASGLAILGLVAMLNPTGLVCVGLSLLIVAMKYLYDYFHRQPYDALLHKYADKKASPEKELAAEFQEHLKPQQQAAPRASEETFWLNVKLADAHCDLSISGNYLQSLVRAAGGKKLLFEEPQRLEQKPVAAVVRSKSQLTRRKSQHDLLIRTHSSITPRAYDDTSVKEAKNNAKIAITRFATPQATPNDRKNDQEIEQLIEDIVYRCLGVNPLTGKCDSEDIMGEAKIWRDGCRTKQRYEIKQQPAEAKQQPAVVGNDFLMSFFNSAQSYAKFQSLPFSTMATAKREVFSQNAKNFLNILVNKNQGQKQREIIREYIEKDSKLDLRTSRRIVINGVQSGAEKSSLLRSSSCFMFGDGQDRSNRSSPSNIPSGHLAGSAFGLSSSVSHRRS